MATAKDILTLNKSKSILQRIGAMWSSVYSKDAKGKLGLFNHYHGFGSVELVDKILERSYNIVNRKDTRIAVMNDFGLEVISRLIEDGFTNVCILCTEENDDLYSLIKFMVKREFNFDKIVRLETNMSDKFDLVIANPPYEIGNAVITETMKHCENAVVLMPIARYKTNNLYKLVTDVTVIPMGEANFVDAATDPHICVLNCNVSNDMSYEEFNLNTFDSTYMKYYTSNLHRYHYAIDSCVTNTSLPKRIPTCSNSFYITERTPSDGVHLIDNNALDIHWNIHKDIMFNDIPNAQGMYKGTWIFFESTQELDNFCNYWYSGGKTGLLHKLIKGCNKQGGSVRCFIPKVDWTRSWTDEEILRDYGYTEDEIKELLS